MDRAALETITFANARANADVRQIICERDFTDVRSNRRDANCKPNCCFTDLKSSHQRPVARLFTLAITSAKAGEPFRPER